MGSIAFDPTDVIVGVDTHKDQHVAVALDGLGRRLGQRFVSAAPAGYADLLAWAAGLGRVAAFGVEGTGSYGLGLARFLRRHAVMVLKVARDTAVTAHSQAMITLKATLVTASDTLRAELEPRTDYALVTACAALEVSGDLADPEVAMRHALGALACRWLALHEEIKAHTRHLKRLTTRTAPALVATFGIGFDSAAELLCAAGDNAGRIRSEAAYAKLCGACPIPASSGKTSRHRLNRCGNRQANAALFRIVVVRMRWHPPTIAYVERRTAEGLSKREIIRCLKRYVAREVYRLLPVPATASAEPLQAA